MGKSERNQAVDMTKQNYNRAVGGYNQVQNDLWGSLPGAREKADDAYSTSSNTYKNSTGGYGAYDPTAYDETSARNKNNATTGGYDPTQMSQVRGDIASNLKEGGYDQATIDRLNNAYTGLTSNGIGGLNPEQTAKVRSGYENLATTGGISEDTAGAMRRQSASGVQSVYETLGRNLTRQQAATGFGGGGGETAQLARQLSNQQATAVTGVNAQIGQMRQQGTIAGLGGLSSFEENAAAGQRSAVAGQQQLGASQAQGRITSAGQESQLATSEAQGRLSASAAEQELATGAAQQKLAAAGGMANLYSSQPGYVTSIVNQILQSQATTGTLTAEQAQIMQELSKQPGLLSNILTGIKGVASIASPVGAAMVGLGSKP